jgi:hypothetical protein
MRLYRLLSSFPSALAWATTICLAAITAVHAAPLCQRPALNEECFTQVNNFAQNPPAQAIVPAQSACGWGIGLVVAATGTGTGFLVDNRREVMTDQHVVDRHCRGNRRFTFRHGFVNGAALSTETATVVASGDYCAQLARGRHDYGGDWVIGVLDRDPAALELAAPAAAMGPLRPHLGGNRFGDDGRYSLLGYGMSFRAGMTPYRSAPCRLGRLFAPDVVEHSCDATHRGSGAPIVFEDQHGRCSVAAIHVGEIAALPGRLRYADDVNANVAVAASRFAPAVERVARDLDRGLDAAQIAAETARQRVR